MRRAFAIACLLLPLPLLGSNDAAASHQSRASIRLPATGPPSATRIGGCSVFPANNPWNQNISRLPVDPSSARYIAAINRFGNTHLHADFGANPTYGIPFRVVHGATPVPITFTEYGEESNPGPYPIPTNTPIEAGSDHHVLVVDSHSCKLYELYNAQPNASGGWDAGSGAVFNLRSNLLRPDTWTSADEAGLPILPGLVRYEEVAAGQITHALRFTVGERSLSSRMRHSRVEFSEPPPPSSAC